MSRNSKGTGKGRPQVSSRLRVSYKRHKEITKNPHAAPIFDKTRVEHRKDPLRGYDVWPCGIKPSPPEESIVKGKITRKAAAEVLDEIKYNFVVHVLHKCVYDTGTEGNQRLLEQQMLRDPLGLNQIPQTNSDFWTTRRVGVPTGSTAVQQVGASTGGTAVQQVGTPTGGNSGSSSEPADISGLSNQSASESSDSDANLSDDQSNKADASPTPSEVEGAAVSAPDEPDSEEAAGEETGETEQEPVKEDPTNQPVKKKVGKKKREAQSQKGQAQKKSEGY